METSRADGDLLREYAEAGSEPAFAELVMRYSGFVYAACLRQVRDAHLAEDVAQAVFILLAGKAKSLSMTKSHLMGWLFKVSRYCSANARKREARRCRHERQAAVNAQKVVEPDWTCVSPVLDPALAALGSNDRDVLLLRYFGGKSHREVGEALGISEAAAKMRLGRALERLKGVFEKHELELSVAGIDAVFAHNAITPAPAGLASHAATMALAPGTAGATTALAIAKGAMTMMTMHLLKVAAAIGLAVAVLGGGAAALVKTAEGPETSGPQAAAPSIRPAASQPATQPQAEKSPKAVVILAYRASLAGDEAAFFACFLKSTAEQEMALKRVTQYMGAFHAFIKAISEKLGEDAPQRLGLGAAELEAGVAQATETITGNSAIVDTGDGGAGKISLVKTSGGWKIKPDDALANPNVSAVMQLYDKNVPVFRQLTADLAAGKYATLEELQQAIMVTKSPR